MTPPLPLVIVGAGAAGLAAAWFAGAVARERGRPVVLLEGARKPGAKILVSGGGRCNVTHKRVTPEDFNGGPRPIVRNVLRAFDEHRTVAWMGELGVRLKEEDTGKLFPVTDSARTVLDALLAGVAAQGVTLRSGCRVTGIERLDNAFRVQFADGAPLDAARVIMATGGLSLPKSGSDGAGLQWMRRLGHHIEPTTPALAPLLLRASHEPGGRFAELAGVTTDVRLDVREGAKALASWTGSTVFTHFGLSGPAPMNMSRHLLQARLANPGAPIGMTLGHPRFTRIEDADAWLQQQAQRHPRRLVSSVLEDPWPASLVSLVVGEHDGKLAEMAREQRRTLAARLVALPIDVAGDRGWSFAETTAGGVSLREVDIRTMESRVVPGLHLCGEMLDVDGRIGGFNFQWAWASGYLAGRGAMALLEHS